MKDRTNAMILKFLWELKWFHFSLPGTRRALCILLPRTHPFLTVNVFFPCQNMPSFCTASPKSLQTLMKSGRRSKRRPTGSRGPTKASPRCPSTCGSTHHMVGGLGGD